MTTQLVKKTLEDENLLLSAMIKFVEDFDGKGFTKEANFIKRSWVNFLTMRYDTNKTQQGLPEDQLKADFLSEICQLGAYLHATDKQPGYSETWHDFLQCECDISGHLHNLIGK